ncbi:MAG TPA: TrmO family methyltransferase [Thermodesulfovibrio thiophilus]|nr:TrmO family methyltransferase [Thermodesulfovibrio thiophilus]
MFDNVIKVRRIDMLDGTPVLDIKPYIEYKPYEKQAYSPSEWSEE